ncbi:hypothetical protein [Paenirhodobacter hankyongi]|nr:hypothetical protein [Sinirhodobacter hankyongi]
MDRISGMLPQIGWSPQLVPAAPKAAPATTVEAASITADTAGGMSANVDTGNGREFLAQLRLLSRQAGADTPGGDDSETGRAGAPAIVPRIEAAPDPDAPTGPPPAFEVTPLEAQAAALRAGPGRLQAEDIAAGASPGEDVAAAGEVQADPTRAAVALTQATGAAAPSDERPAVVPQGAWPLGAEVRGAATPGPSLDVTR